MNQGVPLDFIMELIEDGRIYVGGRQHGKSKRMEIISLLNEHGYKVVEGKEAVNVGTIGHCDHGMIDELIEYDRKMKAEAMSINDIQLARKPYYRKLEKHGKKNKR